MTMTIADTNHPSAALARVADLMPRSLADLSALATIAHKSGLAKCASPEQAAVIILTGMELGLTPMQALRGIYQVEGRPFVAADTMVALVYQSGLCEEWTVTESTDDTCTIRTKRVRREPVTRSFTSADAKRAGIARGAHDKYPRVMLLHRCVAVVAREAYPDVILGMSVPEEQEEIISARLSSVIPRREEPVGSVMRQEQEGKSMPETLAALATVGAMDAMPTAAEATGPTPTRPLTDEEYGAIHALVMGAETREALDAVMTDVKDGLTTRGSQVQRLAAKRLIASKRATLRLDAAAAPQVQS